MKNLKEDYVELIYSNNIFNYFPIFVNRYFKYCYENNLMDIMVSTRNKLVSEIENLSYKDKYSLPLKIRNMFNLINIDNQNFSDEYYLTFIENIILSRNSVGEYNFLYYDKNSFNVLNYILTDFISNRPLDIKDFPKIKTNNHEFIYYLSGTSEDKYNYIIQNSIRKHISRNNEGKIKENAILLKFKIGDILLNKIDINDVEYIINNFKKKDNLYFIFNGFKISSPYSKQKKYARKSVSNLVPIILHNTLYDSKQIAKFEDRMNKIIDLISKNSKYAFYYENLKKSNIDNLKNQKNNIIDFYTHKCSLIDESLILPNYKSFSKIVLKEDLDVFVKEIYKDLFDELYEKFLTEDTNVFCDNYSSSIVEILDKYY